MNNMQHIIKNKQIKDFNMYMKHKIQQKNNNSNSPDQNGKKYLVIMACHSNSHHKFETIRNNLRFFAFENCHKIVINSQNTGYTDKLQEICNRHLNAKYVEVPNSAYIDFGKWTHVLSNVVNYNDYDYIVLTNDSYIIHSSINHFLNLAVKHNVELYGYNDSTQVKYHYQSYLFILRKDAVNKFIARVTAPGPIIREANDIILNFEVHMTDWFSTHKSFLKIGHFELNKGQNIFFTNDSLYLPLKKSGLLPFTKIKRIK
jgi:hypothetical protein